MENNKFKEAIQNSMLEFFKMMMDNNEECRDCPLASELQNFDLD